MVNLVELFAVGDGEDCAFDQRCKYGHRVDGHAVYCHNSDWEDAPRKCRRTWYFGEDYASANSLRDEDCPGFEQNPDYSFVSQKA